MPFLGLPTRTVSPGTATELNQCSFIKDKEVLAQCIERFDDNSHGEDPVETETTTVLNECSFIKDKGGIGSSHWELCNERIGDSCTTRQSAMIKKKQPSQIKDL